MSRFVQTIRVVANPYFALDHKARPCGILPVEPSAVGEHAGFVGAGIDREKTKTRKMKHGELFEPLQDTVYWFSPDAVNVPASPYYLDALRTGAILPADEVSARAAKVTFSEPTAAIEAQRQRAIAKFDLDYGAGSYEHFHPKAETPKESSSPSEPGVAIEAQPTVESPNESSAPEAKTASKKSRNGGES